MPQMMKAIVKRDTKPGYTLESISVPTPRPNEVLVRVLATAICGTDLHIAEWNEWAQNAGIKLPMVMGHEFSGRVVEVGREVRSLRPGDYIAGETHIPCGECYQCKNGLEHICSRLIIFGVHRNGCFAEYTTIPEVCVRRIPETIEPKVGAVLEPLGTSLRSALELEVSGDVVAVIGCGPIGLFAVASARAMGASTIVGLDILEDRLAIAKEVGADYVFNPNKVDVAKEILALTGGVGVDSFIDASGSAHALQGAFKFLRKGGRVALIGLPSQPVCLNLGSDVVFKEARIIGIHGRLMFETWTKMENMLTSGLLNINPIITHEIPLEKCAKGFDLLKEGKSGKVILVP